MESIVGKILCDRYRIIQELDRQEFSTVYLTEDLEQLDRSPWEIEQLQSQYDREVLGARSWQKIRQNFMERGSLLQKITHHPQIPQLLAFFECDREFYLVREHLEGETLAQKLVRSPITEAEAVVWLQEIIEVLKFIHQAGIVHRNIQPSSLFEHRNGIKFLTNFAEVRNAVLSDSVVINPDFTAPESLAADPSSDLYALGKTMIFALTGKVSHGIQKFAASGSELPSADISSELANVLNKMVAERSVRYEAADDVLAELDFDRNVVTLPPPFFDGSYAFEPSSNSNKKTTWSRSFSRLLRRATWSLLTLPFIIALAIVFIGIDRNSDKNFSDYTNYDYQFDLKYPPNWTQQELNDPITGEIVVFTAPAETNSDFRERVYLATESLSSESLGLEEYTQTVLERIELDPGSEFIEEFTTEVSGLPGRAVIYSRQEGGLQLRQMEVFTIKNDRVYLIIYTAQRAEFAKFSDTVEQIIDSWEIE